MPQSDSLHCPPCLFACSNRNRRRSCCPVDDYLTEADCYPLLWHLWIPNTSSSHHVRTRIEVAPRTGATARPRNGQAAQCNTRGLLYCPPRPRRVRKGRGQFGSASSSAAGKLAQQVSPRDDCGPGGLAVLRPPPAAPGDQQATGSDVVGGSQAGGLVPVQNDVADVPAGVAVILSPSGAPGGSHVGHRLS